VAVDVSRPATSCSPPVAYGAGVTAHAERFIDVDGVVNFRDLGGLPTSDGEITRFGVMFRSDALHHLTELGVQRLLELGMRTIIDLRSAVELERSGRGPLEATDLQFFHTPLSHGDASSGRVLPPALAEGDLGRHYVDSLEERSEMLATVIRHLAEEANLPAVFHCTAGKDRTGMVTALVLSIVGVADDVIVHDYTLTDDRMDLVMERIRTTGALPEDAAPMLAKVGRAEAKSMETFLAAVRERHGSAEAWARDSGISDEMLVSLRAALVSG
jgi:protein tyrosine/serine phosphatase